MVKKASLAVKGRECQDAGELQIGIKNKGVSALNFIISNSYAEMSVKAAHFVAAALKAKPDIVLGLPTGSTPIGMYQELVRMHKEEGLDFSQVSTFNLDEYRGLKGDHNQSYRYFMETNLFRHVNIKPENINFLSGVAKDPVAECKRYEEAIIKAGGIDLMILGIGINGHIGFNEPASKLEANSHIVKLTESTIKANARFFEHLEDVPREAITMGVGSILRSRNIILLASGTNKKEAVYGSMSGLVTTEIPGSLLQLHNEVTFFLDTEAAAKIKE